MVYNSSTQSLITRILLIVVSSVLLTLSVALYSCYMVGVITLIILTIQIYNLINNINSVNRKITYFFDAIRNDDNSLVLPEDVKNKELSKLNQSMNRVNRLVSDIKIKNENNVQFLSALIEHSRTGLMTIDQNGYINNINSAAQNYIGTAYVSNMSLIEQKNKTLHTTLSTIQPGERKNIKLLVNNEYIKILVETSIIKFEGIEYKLFSLQNINKELEESELDSWQKLIRVMAHEIMNSIAPITSLSNTLTRFFIKDDSHKKTSEITQDEIKNTVEGLRIIEDQGRSLMHFVENYRRLAKIPQPTIRVINIQQWLKSISTLFKADMIENSIDFRINMDNNIQEINSDERLLNQVVINLLKNSIDAVKESSQKEIAITVIKDDNSAIKISISDTGVGIAPELLDKIFIPFFTTKTEGNGIGLSLSRQIMKKLDGTISVKSNHKNGTCFHLRFIR